MKLVSFQYQGTPSYGLAVDEGIVDVGAKLRDHYPTLQAIIESGAISEVRAYAEGRSADRSKEEIEYLPVISRPEKILCIGVNYEMHRIETGRDESKYPVIFTRFANTLVGHQQPIVRPTVSDQLDYEGELAVVIGKAGRHIKAEDALSHIAGYSCFNDATLRDWQRHTHQFTPGKNFPSTGGFSPWLATTDEIPDPSSLTLVTRLNGIEVQQAKTDQMIFTIPRLISYISAFTEIIPGDTIATGTPGGVGAKRNPPLFMKPGDVVEVEISSVGTLRHEIRQE